jgi:hypothetical protein
MSRNGFSRILALSALSIFVSAPVFSEVPSVQNRRAPLPVKLDGQADEWAPDCLVRDPKSGTEFACRNDGRKAPNSKSGYMSGTGRTWGQEFLDDFDSMSRPSLGTKKFTFAVDVRLAETT